MNKENEDIGQLQEAWLASTRRSADGGCPDADRLFDAVSGALPPDQVSEVVMHTVRCGACAQSWRVAMELQRARSDVARPSFSPRPLSVVWAAAAALMLVVGVVWMLPLIDPGPPGPGDQSIMRGNDQGAIGLLVADRSAVPLDQFRLRWEAVDSASEYRIRVSDAGLTPVYSGTTQEAEIVVPETHFETLSDGDELFWFVVARLDDGSELRSATGTVILADPERAFDPES